MQRFYLFFFFCCCGAISCFTGLTGNGLYYLHLCVKKKGNLLEHDFKKKIFKIASRLHFEPNLLPSSRLKDKKKRV